MFVLGVTGGIGSGKSTVCKVFSNLGIPVYNSDERAKFLMTNNREVKDKLKTLFGSNCFTSEDNLNTKLISDRIFQNEALLSELNSVVHPAVGKDFMEWKENRQSPYLIKEAAILFESGVHKICNKTLLITASEELRIERVIKRDSLKREDVINRMKSQWSDERKSDLCDFIIINNESSLILPEIIRIHNEILEIAKEY